jgi:hypothetical protein
VKTTPGQSLNDGAGKSIMMHALGESDLDSGMCRHSNQRINADFSFARMRFQTIFEVPQFLGSHGELREMVWWMQP